MGNFRHIQSQALEEDLRVDDKPARAQFEAWIMLPLENQNPLGKMRGDLMKMKRGGESRRSAADDDDAVVHFEKSSVRAGPRFEAALVVLFIFVERDVRDRLVRYESFLARVVAGEVEIGVPRARVEIDLIAEGCIVFERDGLLMMRVTVDEIPR